jgi:hypothetical protein
MGCYLSRPLIPQVRKRITFFLQDTVYKECTKEYNDGVILKPRKNKRILKEFYKFCINNKIIYYLNSIGTLWATSIVTTFAPSKD